jgi:hypothetical protein
MLVPVNIIPPEAYVEKYQNFITEKDIYVTVSLISAY